MTWHNGPNMIQNFSMQCKTVLQN